MQEKLKDDEDDLEIEIEEEEEAKDDQPEPDEPAGDEASEAEEDGEEDEPYGQKVQKRIAKERKKRGDVERKLSRTERELQELRQWKEQVERQQVQAQANRSETMVRSKERELQQAIEDGDTQRQVKLQSELADVRMKAQSMKNMAEQQPSRPPETAQTWVSENDDWYGQPDYDVETAAARAIDNRLAQEGYDPNSPAYFAELDRRLYEKFPHLRVEEEKPKAKPKSSPVSSGRRAPPTGGNRVRLTQQDIAIAKSVGLDLNNPEHRKAYARQVQASRRG